MEDKIARVLELVDKAVLEAVAKRRESSSLSLGTKSQVVKLVNTR